MGQAIGPVARGAKKFINQNLCENVEYAIDSGSFAKNQIHEDLDAGRPAIIVCQPVFTGADTYHVMVVYGYADYKGSPGYIVHCGWQSDTAQMWYPESWIGFQIRMSVNHIHTFTDGYSNIQNNYRKIVCDTCGCTSLDHLYDISNNAISDVNYPLEGEITIPSYIYGNPIEAIDSGFSDMAITKINLPYTLHNIANNAFKNCDEMTTITGTSNIQSIGTGAFKGCISLTSINIPAGVTSIGVGAFAGCNNLNITVDSSNPNYSAQDNILYNKAQTEIISTGDINANITIPETVTKVGAESFYENDNLEKLYFEALPVIEDFAFFDCENLDKVYFYSYTTPTLGASAFAYNDFTLYVPYSKQAEYVNTFAGYVNMASSIPIVISFSSDGTVIDTLNTYYGANIPELTVPYKEGYDFEGWYDNAEFTGDEYAYCGLWDTTEDMTVYAKWSPQVFYIYFSGYGSENIEDKEVTYDAAIGVLPNIERDGYTFYGWKNQHGEYYTSETIWQELSNQTVTPDLRANQYTITYDGNGGTANGTSQTVYYDSVISSLATAQLDGYTFSGWNTQADGSGQTIVAPYTYAISDNITLYAQYTANEYNVSFDKQGGVGGSDGVNATFDLPMPVGLTIPTKPGYTFQGYFSEMNGGGTKYYNSDMSGANIWDNSNNSTLYAYWTANQYTVTLDKQSGSGGTNSVVVTFNSDMPEGVSISAPTRTGYLFRGYYQNANGTGIKYYDQDMTGVNVWAINDDSTIYAYWEAETYTVVLQKEGGTGGSDSVQATYQSPMPSATAPTRVGYSFEGYYTQPNGGGTKYYDGDMTSACNWDIAGDRTLYAYWEGNVYTVTIDWQGGTGGTTSIQVTYGSPRLISVIRGAKI